MPSARICTGPWARACGPEMLEAVQAALVEALKIPETDRDIVLDIVEDSLRVIRPTRSDHFTRVEIMLFSGRSLAAKRRLYGGAGSKSVGSRRAAGRGQDDSDRSAGGKLGASGR